MKIPKEQFYEGLREKDKENLDFIIDVFQRYGLSVTARGSSVARSFNKLVNANYSDIDLLAIGDVRRYFAALRELRSDPANIRFSSTNATEGYMETLVVGRTDFLVNGTLFDISFANDSEKLYSAYEGIGVNMDEYPECELVIGSQSESKTVKRFNGVPTDLRNGNLVENHHRKYWINN